jgi:hypothetical protein
MEISPTNMSRPDKCMVSVHAKGNVSHIEVEDLLWNTHPLSCIYQAILPLSKCSGVEGCIL